MLYDFKFDIGSGFQQGWCNHAQKGLELYTFLGKSHLMKCWDTFHECCSGNGEICTRRRYDSHYNTRYYRSHPCYHKLNTIRSQTAADFSIPSDNI